MALAATSCSLPGAMGDPAGIDLQHARPVVASSSASIPFNGRPVVRQALRGNPRASAN
jgi:hypothetical protein